MTGAKGMPMVPFYSSTPPTDRFRIEADRYPQHHHHHHPSKPPAASNSHHPSSNAVPSSSHQWFQCLSNRSNPLRGQLPSRTYSRLSSWCPNGTKQLKGVDIRLGVPMLTKQTLPAVIPAQVESSSMQGPLHRGGK